MAVVIGEHPDTTGDIAIEKTAVTPELKASIARAFVDDAKPEVEETAETPDATEKEKTEKPEPAVEHKEAASASDTTEKETPAKLAEDAKATETASAESVTPFAILPAAYRRTLKAAEYSDAEIDEAVKLQGDKFVQYAGKLHQARNKETEAFAKLGQRMAEEAKKATPAQRPAALPTIDTELLAKTYGKDEAFVQQLARLNDWQNELQRILPVIRQYEEKSKAEARDGFIRQVHGFFSADDKKEFADYYGTDPVALTPAQDASRVKVLDMANMIQSGAASQGRNLGLQDALQMAHEATTSEYVAKVTREKLAAEIKQRSRGAVLKPAGRQAATGIDKPDLRKAVREGLKKAMS